MDFRETLRRKWDIEEEELEMEEEDLEDSRGELSKEELRKWEKELADKKLKHNIGKGGRMGKRRMRQIILSMINNPKREV